MNNNSVPGDTLLAPGEAPKPTSADANQPPEKEDWWDDFRRAVEDPDVNIYEYLRDHVMGTMDMDNKAGLSENIVRARKAALRELLSLTKPEEISKKLKSLEGNGLLFPPKARAILRVTRAVVDTYVKTDEQLKEKSKTTAVTQQDIGATLAKTLKGELDEAGANPALESIAETFKDKSEEEVAATIREAARQLGEKRSVQLMVRDAARFARAYLTAENIVNIAIIALPLITWQYRWALAIGLGAYSGRKAVYHGYKGARAHLGGDKAKAREHGRDALTALKAAGGNVLIIGLSPVLAKYPVMIAGLIGLGVDALYNSTIDFFKKMLKEEENAPGSTPLGKRAMAGLRYFFTNYKDKIASVGAKVLKTMAPHTVTAMVEEVVQRLPFSKMQKIAKRSWMLGGALATRFNKIARATARQYAENVKALGADIADAARDFRAAVEAGLDRAAEIGREIERTRLAEEERLRAAAKAAAEDAEREKRLKETEILTVAELAENEKFEAESAKEAFNEAKAAEAAQKRKLESMARHREEQQKKSRTLKARPD